MLLFTLFFYPKIQEKKGWMNILFYKIYQYRAATQNLYAVRSYLQKMNFFYNKRQSHLPTIAEEKTPKRRMNYLSNNKRCDDPD